MKNLAVENKVPISHAWSATFEGKGPWDPFGGNTKRTYQIDAVPELGTKARNIYHIRDWFRKNRSVALRLREESYEGLIYHATRKEEVQEYEAKFQKVKTLKGIGGRPIIKSSHHVVVTADPDDKNAYMQRFHCGVCGPCTDPNADWLNCTRKYICGRYTKISFDPDLKSVGTKRKRPITEEDFAPIKKLNTGKFLCTICCGSKPIQSSSVKGHILSKKHQSNLIKLNNDDERV